MHISLSGAAAFWETGRRGMARKFKDITHEYNSDFEKLISDHSHNQLHSVCNYTVIRPAYAYTSQCFNEYWRDGVTPGYYAAKPKKRREHRQAEKR